MKIYYLLLFVLFIFSIILIIKKYVKKKIITTNIYNSDIIKMYYQSNSTVIVHTGAGLGNRLMSVVGIIIISIYFQSKPKSIKNKFNIVSTELE